MCDISFLSFQPCRDYRDRHSFPTRRSSDLSGVFRRRTPQLMSNPIAPGLITPRSASVATTPPTGRPYPWWMSGIASRSEEHTSELQSHSDLVCRLLLEKKKKR